MKILILIWVKFEKTCKIIRFYKNTLNYNYTKILGLNSQIIITIDQMSSIIITIDQMSHKKQRSNQTPLGKTTHQVKQI